MYFCFLIFVLNKSFKMVNGNRPNSNIISTKSNMSRMFVPISCVFFCHVLISFCFLYADSFSQMCAYDVFLLLLFSFSINPFKWWTATDLISEYNIYEISYVWVVFFLCLFVLCRDLISFCLIISDSFVCVVVVVCVCVFFDLFTFSLHVLIYMYNE